MTDSKSNAPADVKSSAAAGSPNNAYLLPPQVVTRPGPEHQAGSRKFQGIPSIACGKSGRLFAVWYGGKTPGEDKNNYISLAESSDGGRTWSPETLAIDPDGEGPVRAYDPEIWLAPDGRLWLFWAQGMATNFKGTTTGVWAMTADEAEGAGNGNGAGKPLTWSAPRRLCDGVMMCKPLVLSTGEWVLPVSHWNKPHGSGAMFVSTDAGQSWAERGACDSPPEIRSHDEHMIVERRDGSLWMLIRTKYGIGQSVSTDAGRTWSAVKPTDLPHPSSRFFIRRLASGRLLLVRHDAEAADVPEGGKVPRSHLTAYLSDDDGATWPHSLLLDERVTVSYPDGDQAEDGSIYLIYDYQRTGDREILLAVFNEAHITGEASIDPQLRLLVNKASG